MKSFTVFFALLISSPFVINTDEVLPYPDNSLYVEQYQMLGMPSPNEVWNAAEYKRAVKVIKGYYNVDKWSIPRKDSDYSGALFERMTKIENFEIIADKSESIQERLREHDELLRAVGQLMSMYIESNEAVQRFGAEGLAFRILSAKTSVYSIDVLKDLQLMMSDRGQRNSDLDLMTNKLMNGIPATIEECLSVITGDYFQYQSKDLEWFAQELSNWSGEMKDYLSEAQIVILNKKLNLLKETHPNESVKNAMSKMQGKLK
ncbi:MAG: hypothetical protein ACI97N_000528 [Cognaticolwellia sp.]|jgi:hypothetical protein